MWTENTNYLDDSWSLFVKNGDERAFYSMYAHYNHILVKYAVKKGFSVDLAQDTINEVFLYLWENLDIARGIIKYNNYIITFFNRKLYKGSNVNAFDPLEDIENHANYSQPSVEEHFIERQQDLYIENLLEDKVSALSEKQRLIIYQKFFLGLSYPEIARANSQSINTVYNTLYTSIEKLRKSFTPEQEVYLKIAIGALSTIFLFFFCKH